MEGVGRGECSSALSEFLSEVLVIEVLWFCYKLHDVMVVYDVYAHNVKILGALYLV